MKVVTDEDEQAARAEADALQKAEVARGRAPAARKTDGKDSAEAGRGAAGPARAVTPREPGRAPGRATPPPPPRRVRLPKNIIKRYDLSPQEVEVIEEAIHVWRLEMGKRMKMDPYAGSNEAHAAAQEILAKRFPKQVVSEEPTGITDERKASGRNLKTGDIQVNRDGGEAADLKSHIAAILEFKRSAGLRKGGQLAVKGRELGLDEDVTIDNPQTDAYNVLTNELGVPVFVVSEKGRVYLPTRSGTWTKIIDPDTDADE